MYSPVDIYQLKVNYEISRAKCKIYPKSKTKTKEQHHLTSFWCLNRQLRAHPTPCRNVPIANFDTAWKVSKYRVFSGPYFPYLDWIWSISPYSVQMRENTDHKKLRIWTLFAPCELLWWFWQKKGQRHFRNLTWRKILK